MRPTLFRPQQDFVITDAVNADSSCLAADAATAASWYQGFWENPAASTARRALPHLIVPESEVINHFRVRGVLAGIMDHQNAGAFDLQFGIWCSATQRSADDAAAVQTAFGSANGTVVYTHTKNIVPTTTFGMFKWEFEMLIALSYVIDADAGTTAWKQMWDSKLKYHVNVAINTEPSAPTVSESMGISNYNFTNGVRFTPFVKKTTAVNTRILTCAGQIEKFPESDPASFRAL